MTDNEYKGFTVRRACCDDINDIATITHYAFLKYADLAGLSTLEALRETYDDIAKDLESKIVLVAFFDNKIVGSVRVEVDGETGYLSRFGVNNDYQNLGIGKALIYMVDLEMRECGVKTLKLHTASKISSLIRFYYGRGFYIDSTTKDDGYIRALLVKEY